MDIWSWVQGKIEALQEAGHDRLADIIMDLPHFTVDGHHSKVDALAAEGVALARKLDEKWVEVFLRHWHLQSLILHRNMARKGLPEAVSLLEFSHRGDTIDCPQSVCVVQDLAVCYGCIDGPAYVEERIAVAAETFQRIDPSWPCYSCIGAEYADALIDGGRFEEAIRFLDSCDEESLRYGEPKDMGDLLVMRVTALMRTGQVKKAAELLSKADGSLKGRSFERETATLFALMSALEGEFEKAEEQLPEFRSLAADDYRNWLETKYRTALNVPQKNNGATDYFFSVAVDTLGENGAVRDAVEIGFWAAELALKRNQPITAEFHLRNVEQLLGKLYKDLGARDRWEKARSELEEISAHHAQAFGFKTAEAVLEATADEAMDDETKFASLVVAVERWPDHEKLVCTLASSMRGLGRFHEAGKILKAFLERHADSPEAVLDYAYMLFRKQIPGTTLAEFCAGHLELPLSEDAKDNIHWVLAKEHEQEGRSAEACALLEKILANSPEAFNSRLKLATLRREMGDYTSSAANLDYLIERHEGDNDLLWDRVVVATLMRDWSKARALSAALNMELEGEGEIRENWGAVRIRLVDENGDPDDYSATRTGPVTAVIRGINRIGERQYFGDEVVFDPAPLNVLDHKDEEGDPMDADGYDTRLFRQIACVRPGGYATYAVDGVSPGSERIEALKGILKEYGVILSVRSSEEYQITEEDEQEHPGIYLYLLLPESASLEQVHEILTENLADLAHPLVWPELAEAAGDSDAAARFREIAERYGL